VLAALFALLPALPSSAAQRIGAYQGLGAAGAGPTAPSGTSTATFGV
jgi:hypothetical protein